MTAENRNVGIDYGMGIANRDLETGIRYGVIPSGAISQAWYDAAESDYGEPICPNCDATVSDSSGVAPYCYCPHCGGVVDGDEKGLCKACSFFEDKADMQAVHPDSDYHCLECHESFWSDAVTPEEPLGWYVDDGEYRAWQNGGDSDIFVQKSPFYTYAKFCSPCAPGACYLENPLLEDDATDHDRAGLISNRCYCFGHDWFLETDDKRAPYPVYRVDNGELVRPEA